MALRNIQVPPGQSGQLQFSAAESCNCPDFPGDGQALLDQLQAAIDAQKTCCLGGDEPGTRQAGAAVSRILSQLENRKDSLTSESVRRLLAIRDAHRAVCLAVADERSEVLQRLQRLGRGKSAAAAYGPHRAGF